MDVGGGREVSVEMLEPLLRDHEYFRGLDPGDLTLLVGCAANVRFGEGTFLFREGRQPTGST